MDVIIAILTGAASAIFILGLGTAILTLILKGH